jgi:hypothetical protein
MNKLAIGLEGKSLHFLPAKQGFLLIDDGPLIDIFLERYPRAKLFDPTVHSFNPLKGIDYRRARDLAAAVYTASPQGENTLTVRNGKRALTKLLLANTTRLDRLEIDIADPGEVEARATIDDLLLSPVLTNVLCKTTNFSFRGGNPPSSVVAKIDRAQLGDFDAFVLASLLIGQSKGQVIVPDFGFYGRDFHTALIRQNRLTAGVNFLQELTLPLQQAVLSMQDKTLCRLTREDAERLIFYTDNPLGNPTNLM